jgi:hypothetical protein
MIEPGYLAVIPPGTEEGVGVADGLKRPFDGFDSGVSAGSRDADLEGCPHQVGLPLQPNAGTRRA